MTTMSFLVTGTVNVSVTVTEQDDGTLRFDLSVLDDTGQIGDLNGLFLDLADDSITGTLTATGTDLTGAVFKVNAVTKVESYNNVTGEVVNELGKFDLGVQFGTAGIGADDIRHTSFTLASSAGPLTLDAIALQDIALRLTSVGTEGGSRSGSLKLGGEVPEAPDDHPPPPQNLAEDDYITVYLSAPDYFDFLDSGAQSVLANDTGPQGVPYDGLVADLDWDNFVVTLTGSNGGTLDLYVDGAVDFHAGSDFAYLTQQETAQTEFVYAIEGGDTAVIHVTVIADPILG